jgi:FkbM family methyltransferase
MGILNLQFKPIFKKALQRHGIYIFRSLPRGIDLLYDLTKAFPQYRFSTIFDVGANVGQSAAVFLQAFSGAQIWCFEPSGLAYAQLCARFARESKITCEQIAFGETEEDRVLRHTADPTMFHIAKGDIDAPEITLSGSCETVRVKTLDTYCSEKSVTHINLLKIDTEGHDLEVIRGAKILLQNHRIDCLYCECSTDPENRFHSPFWAIKEAVEPAGYRVFGFYEQFEEVFKKRRHLRRVNVAYVSPHLNNG